MGSGSSKIASTAVKAASKVGASARKYPSRPPPPSSRTNAPPSPPARERVRPSLHTQVGVARASSEARDKEVDLDVSDLDLGLAARLSQLGPVQPNPTQSNSSTFNHPSSQSPQASGSYSTFIPSVSTPSQSIFPNARQNAAVSLLTARYRLAEEAEIEFSNIGRKGADGRQFLDVVTIRQILVLRDEKGVSAEEIERRLGLRAGVVGRLGARGVVNAGS